MIDSGLLPPTDSRFRSDIRITENGDFKEANKHKKKLERARATC